MPRELFCQQTSKSKVGKFKIFFRKIKMKYFVLVLSVLGAIGYSQAQGGGPKVTDEVSKSEIKISSGTPL